MKVNEFFAKYANVRLEERGKIVNILESGLMTLDDFFFALQKLEDTMRPYRIEEDKLLRIVSDYLLTISSPKGEK